MRSILFILMCLSLISCQTVSHKKEQINDSKEGISAMGSIAEALTGKSLTEEEKKDMVNQIRKDPEAQSAIESITNSMTDQKPRVKYSPATGKRYSGNLDVDPETGVKLEWVTE